jgi:hypothetical protein
VPADAKHVTLLSDLDRLSSGTLDWLSSNLEFFNPYSTDCRSPVGRKVKAALELALLCHFWEKLGQEDDRLTEATDLLRMIWQRPDFPQLLAVPHPHYSRQYQLIYVALAPSGISDELPRTVLARLAAEDHMSAQGKSSYLRLETRYYADKAGLRHEIESYAQLFEGCFPAKQASIPPVTGQEAYAMTHASFYVSDFGFRQPDYLPCYYRQQAAHLISGTLDYAVQEDWWDLVAELITAQFCLGGDPVSSASAACGIRSLARSQIPSGAIPGISATAQAKETAAPEEFFLKSYHTTLVVALMSLIISSALHESRQDVIRSASPAATVA